jgi:hypothetical protein
MPQKSEAPRYGGASRNSCGGPFRDPLTALEVQTQFLISAYLVSPKLATMLAHLAFGGGSND